MPEEHELGVEVPQAIALGPGGEKVLVAPRPWRRAYGYWSAYELCTQLAASGFAALDRKDSPPLRWDPDVEPGSTVEHRQVIDGQMKVSQLAMLSLSAAQVVCVPPRKHVDVEQFSGHQQAQQWALDAPLAYDPVYLDLSDSGRSQAAGVEVSGENWPVGGALLWRHDAGMSIVVFAAPPDENGGPAHQPLAHVLVGRAPGLPAPGPGEITVDAATGQSITPLVNNPASALNRRMHAALSLATATLAVARHLDTAELVSEVGDPKQRARYQQRGEEVALTPRRRRR